MNRFRWHPSWLVSLVFSVITHVVNLYRAFYYGDQIFRANATESDPTGGRRWRVAIFHGLRLALHLVFVCLIWRQYTGNLTAVRWVCGIFCVLVVENILSQWAELMTFVNFTDSMILNLLCRDRSCRDTLFEFRRLREGGFFGPSGILPQGNEECLFKARMDEHLEEIRSVTARLRPHVFTYLLLPLRHIFSLLVIWTLMMISLQLQAPEGAFTRMHLSAKEGRSLSTFVYDTWDTVYSSAGCMVGFGDLRSEEDPANNRRQDPDSDQVIAWRRSLGKWIVVASIAFLVTILVYFSVAFGAADQAMDSVKDAERLAGAIREFVLWGRVRPQMV